MTYSNREQSFGFILFGWARAGAIVTSLISTSTILALGYQDAGCSGNGLSLPKPNVSSQWNSTLNMTINITGTVSKIRDIVAEEIPELTVLLLLKPIQGPCLTSALLPGSVISLGLSIEGAVSMVLARESPIEGYPLPVLK